VSCRRLFNESETCARVLDTSPAPAEAGTLRPSQESGRPAQVPRIRCRGGFGVLLAGLIGAAVAARRLAPVPIYLLAAVATGLLASWGFLQDPVVGLALVLYAVSAACTLAWSVPALAIGWLTVAVSSRLPEPVPPGNDRIVATLAVLTAAGAMGTALRTQRRYASGARDRAQLVIAAYQSALVR
jgi:hypothetical protein